MQKNLIIEESINLTNEIKILEIIQLLIVKYP